MKEQENINPSETLEAGTYEIIRKRLIASAAMRNAYRAEPPFKLKGSYRDMNKMLSKIVPLMNPQEVESIILTHYENESQTLTTDSESNLLKLKEIANMLTADEKVRWEQIKEVFNKNNQFFINHLSYIIYSSATSCCKK